MNRVMAKISAAIVRLIARSPAMSASLARMAASTVSRFSPAATVWVRVSCRIDMPLGLASAPGNGSPSGQAFSATASHAPQSAPGDQFTAAGQAATAASSPEAAAWRKAMRPPGT
ncbi:hypothetical protein D3C80_1283980 [compost metagenome]